MTSAQAHPPSPPTLPDSGDIVPSYYAATAHPQPASPPLRGKQSVDVAIIGGGFTGLNTAIELARKGFQVALVEARRVGWGCSGRNGGQVIVGLAAYERLQRHLGREDALRAWSMGVEGLEMVFQRIREFDIACDARRGYFEAAWTQRQMASLLEAAAREQALGYPHALTVVAKRDLRGVVGSDAYAGGLLDSGSGHVHPLNLCLGEARGAIAAGVRIFEHSPVRRVVPGLRPSLVTAQGSIDAGHIVVAGNAYLQDVVPRLRRYILPAGSYIIATEPLGSARAAEILPRDSCVCDQNVLLDYYRLSADGRLLFGGRCNHTGRVPRDISRTLLPRLLKVFPYLRGVRIDYQWGGNVAVSLKRIPQLGRLPGGIVYAQGYSGHGIVPSHLAGRLLAEVIAGSETRFDVLARLQHWRLPVGAWFSAPALALGMTYYRLKDLF